MRGKRKNRLHGFQKGNIPHNKKIPGEEANEVTLIEERPGTLNRKITRPSKSDFEQISTVTQGGKSIDVLDSDGRPCDTMFLRPKILGPETMLESHQSADDVDPELKTHRIFQKEKVLELFNQAFREHRRINPTCDSDMEWDEEAEVKWGLGWQEGLKCPKCHYRSGKMKLYNEVTTTSRGRKAASINYGLQVGLSHTAISNTGMSNVLLAMNIPSPSLSAMQKSANKVGDLIVQENEGDMKRIREDLGRLNEVKGLPRNTGVNVEMDSRYNNPPYTCVGNTPYQAASQVCHVTVENMTKKKFVVNMVSKNKLCQKGEIIRRKTGKRPCPDHSGCTANIPETAVIGNEKQWAKESIKTLSDEGFNTHIITTDPDSSSYRAASELHADGMLKYEAKHQLDTRHFSNNQRKLVLNSKFSTKMFRGNTVKERNLHQARLSNDLPARCQAEHKGAMQHFGGDQRCVKRSLTYARDSVVLCYQGDHSQCAKKSFACKGRKRNNWLKNSAFLNENMTVMCSDSDKEKLIQCIDYRLGQKALDKTCLLLTTQKTEAVNRAISNTNPKNKTFSRNYHARQSSAVSSVNHGIGESILKQCKFVGANLVPGSKVAHGLHRRQLHDQARKQAKKSIIMKYRRFQKRQRLFRQYDADKYNKCYQKNMYFTPNVSSGQSLKQRSPSKRVQTGHEHDHTYS
jgi:hypothetical protein